MALELASIFAISSSLLFFLSDGGGGGGGIVSVVQFKLCKLVGRMVPLVAIQD